jgi:hypothetical protein
VSIAFVERELGVPGMKQADRESRLLPFPAVLPCLIINYFVPVLALSILVLLLSVYIDSASQLDLDDQRLASFPVSCPRTKSTSRLPSTSLSDRT